MEKFNRAERRLQLARIKAKRKGYWYRDTTSMTPRRLGMVAQTPALCSCPMCGNARRYFKEKTLKEVLQFIELKETNHDSIVNITGEK